MAGFGATVHDNAVKYPYVDIIYMCSQCYTIPKDWTIEWLTSNRQLVISAKSTMQIINSDDLHCWLGLQREVNWTDFCLKHWIPVWKPTLMTISESHFASLNCITSGALISHFLSYSYLVCSNVLPLNFRYKLFCHLKLQIWNKKAMLAFKGLLPKGKALSKMQKRPN